MSFGAGAALLVFGEEPVPAAHRVRRGVLIREQDEQTLGVGELRDARQSGEIAGGLRASVNGDEQRTPLRDLFE